MNTWQRMNEYGKKRYKKLKANKGTLINLNNTDLNVVKEKALN